MENYDKEKIKEAIENIRATISEEGRNQTARSNYYDKTRIIEIERYLKNSKIQNLNAIIDQCDLINANRIESEILSQIEDFIRDNDYNTRVGTHYYYDTTFVNEYYGEVGHKAVQESKILQAFIPIKLKISTNLKFSFMSLILQILCWNSIIKVNN